VLGVSVNVCRIKAVALVGDAARAHRVLSSRVLASAAPFFLSAETQTIDTTDSHINMSRVRYVALPATDMDLLSLGIVHKGLLARPHSAVQIFDSLLHKPEQRC